MQTTNNNPTQAILEQLEADIREAHSLAAVARGPIGADHFLSKAQALEEFRAKITAK